MVPILPWPENSVKCSVQFQKLPDLKVLVHFSSFVLQFFVKSYDVCSYVLNSVNMCFGVVNHLESFL